MQRLLPLAMSVELLAPSETVGSQAKAPTLGWATEEELTAHLESLKDQDDNSS